MDCAVETTDCFIDNRWATVDDNHHNEWIKGGVAVSQNPLSGHTYKHARTHKQIGTIALPGPLEWSARQELTQAAR